jgi:hypothetical protein
VFSRTLGASDELLDGYRVKTLPSRLDARDLRSTRSAGQHASSSPVQLGGGNYAYTRRLFPFGI